jgi:methyl-accepting chemotaxis protein
MDSINEVLVRAGVTISEPEPPHTTRPAAKRHLVLAETIRRHNIAIAWLAVSVGGAVAISAINGQSMARLVVPCVLMAAYLWYAVAQSSRDLEKVADSVYFLGFLWTLYALTQALIVSRGVTIKASDVFSIFGYALVTTALGMFLRMAVLQFRYTVADQMLEAQEEFAERIERFSREVDATCALMLAFRSNGIRASEEMLTSWTQNMTQMQGVIAQTTTDALTGIRKAADAVSNEIQGTAESTKQVSSAMSNVTRTTSSVLKRLDANQERWITALDNAVTSTDSAMNRWAQRVGSVDISPDLFKGKIEASLAPVIAGAAAAGSAMNEWADKARRVEVPTNAFETKLDQALGPVTAATTAIGSAIQASAKQIQAIQLPSDSFAKAVEHALQPLSKSAAELNAHLSSAGTGAHALRQELDRSVHSMQGLTTQLTHAVRHLAEFDQSVTRERDRSRWLVRWLRRK